jgi:hypothetical protein
MIRRYRNTGLAARSIGLAAMLLGLLAPAAAAAPSFSVELTRDAAAVSHSDERLDYTVKVTNTAPLSAAVGDQLFCAGTPPDATWFNASNFEFQWVANGVELDSVEDIAHGSQTQTYTVQAGDEGKGLQCVIVGSGTTATPVTAAAATVTQPPILVEPASATMPPTPSNPTDIDGARPRLSGGDPTLGEKRTCSPPENWTGATSYSYQWLRDGAPIAGATSNEYEPLEGEDKGHVLQCEVWGENAGGSTIGISNTSGEATVSEGIKAWWGVADGPNNNISMPTVKTPNSTRGPVTLELLLSGGEETYAFETKGEDWACDKAPASGGQPAKVECTRSDALDPGASYPPLTVATALGADAPDIAIAKATVSGGGAEGPAGDEDEFEFAPLTPFGLTAFEAAVRDEFGNEYTQAGGHPFLGEARFALATKRRTGGVSVGGQLVPVEFVKQVFTDLPRSFAGNVRAIPELCPGVASLLNFECPAASMVGGVDLLFSTSGLGSVPLYAIEPEFGAPVQFAFTTFGDVFTLTARLRPDDGYAASIDLSPSPIIELLEAKATVCGFGGKRNGANFFVGCKEKEEASANPIPFFSNPTRCGEPRPVTGVRLTSWEHPAIEKEYKFTNAEITGCDAVHFEPQIGFTPSSHQADSPTGMDVNLTVPTAGIEEPGGIAQANLKRARVVLPEGMAVNATAGKGLGACTQAQIGFERRPSDGKIVPNDDPVACPDSSKIGTLTVKTPLLPDTFTGTLYIAKQGDNPFGSLLAVYMVIESPRRGILVKLAGLVEPDPKTGQLVVTFNENPEVPFSSLELHLPQGPRSPLLNPPTCGTYQIVTELSPWNAKDPSNPTAAEIVTQKSSYDVNSGPGGGPCPSGNLDAKLNAGTENPVAGQTSPFVFRLSREDGTQRFSGVTVHTPPGLTAYLKGIPYCPDAVLASIPSKEGTGQAQIDSPSCPAASQVGTAIAGAGAGADPLFVDTGKVYLAGPYKGAPLSLVVVAPAVAGPIDLGNVVVRTALNIDPETTQITAVTDPVPTILHGVLLDLRDIRVALDRPHFTLNPTNCEPLSVKADVKGEKGATQELSNRFQVDGCKRLSFGPNFSLRLLGGTKRGDNPQLRTVLTAGPGEANIGRAAVTIPRSEFLDQSHIRTICTRVQFAADACPKGSIYGHARALTPLLDYPVEGPVYLRSSNHKLPDLVVDLHGPEYQPVEAVVVGRIDSVKGQIRATIEAAPDVPVTKFVLTQQGGKKGLLVNSRDVCASKNRATVRLTGQNGMTHNTRPAVRSGNCDKQRKHRRHQGQGAGKGPPK